MFEIQYREPILGGNRKFLAKTRTLMDAIASFNLHKGGFDTPLRVKRINVDGLHTHTRTLDGRYSVPRQV
ncbi:uncharacterized protein METZ01_LOCUS371944 [marine metagenome]|uniref:Uncharacterized protein n=1 Tax=marine metagenome TaxID=408172 RepID=A0A382TAD6_9ZZZZ